MVLDFDARAQDFLKRITPLSADPHSHSRPPETSQICQAEVRTLKAHYTLATVKLALSKYRERDPLTGTHFSWAQDQVIGLHGGCPVYSFANFSTR